MNTYIFKIGNHRVFTISNRENFQYPNVGEIVCYNQHDYVVTEINHHFSDVGHRTSKTAMTLQMELVE